MFKITFEGLDRLIKALNAGGRRVLAPTEADGRTELQEIGTLDQMSKDYLQTILSAKESVFPKVERLMRFKTFKDEAGRSQVELLDAVVDAKPTVLLGVRPCEAAAFGALDAVFNWDTRDKFFNARLEQLTVIGFACEKADASCFCTAVGGGPADTKGSDILLTSIADGYVAEVLTEKGRALQALVPEVFQPLDSAVDKRVAVLEPAFDQPALTAKLPGMFESELWMDQSLRCVGCGACAFVCPTCVCFDIQEEADPKGGQRLRCWDSCGFSLFTLHASGHNPREKQSQRWRQRVYHKFSYYPERYQMLGCVGCGKCSRACPVDMNLKGHLVEASRF